VHHPGMLYPSAPHPGVHMPQHAQAAHAPSEHNEASYWTTTNLSRTAASASALSTSGVHSSPSRGFSSRSSSPVMKKGRMERKTRPATGSRQTRPLQCKSPLSVSNRIVNAFLKNSLRRLQLCAECNNTQLCVQ
jgi:hypothetical protein